MSLEYSYGELEDKRISIFRAEAPDFEAAEALIRLGADVNKEGKDSYRRLKRKSFVAF
ncbi:MAG: hypothetical protein PUF80_07045 [Firmicutes bacterium]|nr:hypothetical protein [Bacillota bacterium]